MTLYSGIHCKIVSALFIVIAVVLLIVLLRMLCFEVLHVSRVPDASLLKRAVPTFSDAILRLYRPVTIPVQILFLSLQNLLSRTQFVSNYNSDVSQHCTGSKPQ
jgi:hypothetical protein